MKYLGVLILLCTFVSLIDGQQFNVDNYLYNRVWMRTQLNCLLDWAPCDDTGKTMKGLAGWLLKDRCKDCGPEMKQAATRAISHLQKYYRREWRLLNQKYRQ